MCVQCGGSPSDQAIDHSITHPMAASDDWQVCNECGQHVSRHPDKMDYLAKRQMENIIEYGHAVQLIFPVDQDEGNPFAYSVGRCVKDRPELLVTGWLSMETLGYIVNRVAEIDDERGVQAGDVLEGVLEGYSVRIVEVKDLTLASMYDVVNHFGDVPALQIVWPDMEGRFPGEVGCELRQPVYDETYSGFSGVLKECESCGASVLCSPDEPAPTDCKDHS
jgi:hypothetical protein